MAGGTVNLCGYTVESNTATGPSVPPVGQYLGGGIYIAAGATVYIDASSVDSVDPTVVTKNTDSSGTSTTSYSSTANIGGTYILQDC
jgi:hypothetical protein